MDLIILGFLHALAYIVVCAKILGLRRMMAWRKILDAIFTIGVPFLFLGTFSGMVMTAFGGLWFTLILELMHRIYLIKPFWRKI